MPRSRGGRNVTPAVAVMAGRLEVDLDRVTPTGAGGRVTVADVRAAARAKPADDQEALYRRLFGDQGAGPVRAASTSVRGSRRSRRSVFASAEVVVDDFSSNPLVDDFRQANPGIYQQAVGEGEPPTLFESGDLPPFTASGVDPQMLNRLPWQVRHAAARATDRGEVQQMFEEYAPSGSRDRDDKLAMAEIDHGGDDGNVAYQQRVTRWGSGQAY
jgi:2-oxoacid dehydrogenase-like protein with E3 subunit-binding domain